MKKTVLVPVVTGILALVLGFAGGTLYEKNKVPQRGTSVFQTGANFGSRGTYNGAAPTRTGNTNGIAARNGAPVSGKITAADATSITVQSNDGSSKIVLLSDQTKINKTTTGTAADLQVGSEVMIVGNTTNGTITADSITLGGFMRDQISPTPTATK